MRIPLSWLTAFLGRELSARTVDDLLGEAGVTVTAVEPLGLLHPGWWRPGCWRTPTARAGS